MKLKTCLKPSHRSYWIAAGVTTLISAVLALLLQIYPFGDSGLMFIDGSQYYSAAAFLQRSILEGDSLLYNWGNSLGGSGLSLLAYYASSPFNLLTLLFPHNLLLGMHLIIFLKLLCASLAFCFLLEHKAEGYTWEKGILSGCYPFMGYVMTYIWNVSWLDGIIMLPLMCLGVRLLVREKKFLLYILSLAFTLFSNYYIGFMLCIGSVLTYFLELVLDPEGFLPALKRSLLLYTVSSLLAGGLAMIICLPAFLSLPEIRTQSLSDLFYGNEVEVPYDVMGAMCFSGSWSLLLPYPALFFGIPTLVLAFLYFFNSAVPMKRKLSYGVVILFFLVSMHSSFLNALWHGTSSPHCFNCRYTFLLCFLLLVISFESYVSLPHSKPHLVLYGLPLVVFLILKRNLMVWNSTPSTRLLDLVMVVCSLFCIWAMIRKIRFHRFLAAGFACALILNMTENSLLILRENDQQEILSSAYTGLTQITDRSPSQRTGKGLQDSQRRFYEDFSQIPQDGFYRMENLNSWYRCDSTLYGYKGIANFSSTESPKVTQLMHNLGSTWFYEFFVGYDGMVSPSVESLLGVRYLLSQEPLADDKGYDRRELPSGTYLYENPHALSAVFPVEALDNQLPSQELPFLQINRYYESITGKETPVFEKTDYVLTKLSSDAPNSTALALDLTVADSRPVYLSSISLPHQPYKLPAPQAVLTVNGEDSPLELDANHRIFCLGSWEPGTELHLELTYQTQCDPAQMALYQENRELSAEALDSVPEVDIQEHSSSHLSFTLNTEQEIQPMATTIPFDRGWKVTDNGKPLEILSNWNDCLLAFNLEGPGEHQVELTYMPVGLPAGICVSLLSLAGLAALNLIARKKVRKSSL